MNLIKGFIIGIGKIIPGVSGAMLAITMGVYDKAIFYICNFKNNIKDSIKYLLPLGIGIIISIILFSKIISLCLSKYFAITMFFFIGLIVGGIPSVIEKVNKKDYYITAISFIIFLIISVTNINNNYIIKNNFIDSIIFFASGVIEAIGTIVPGISGTALLMIIGTYNSIIYSIGNITNIKIMIPFIIGIGIGIITFIKLVDYLFKNFSNKMYSFILGLLLSSIFLLVIQVFKTPIYFINLIIGIIFMVFGIFISTLFKEK